MNANDIKVLINNYKSTENVVFDQIADNFLLEVEKEINSAITQGFAIPLFGCNGFCVSISSINRYFSFFKFDVTSWTLHHGKKLNDYDLLSYDQYVEKTDLKSSTSVKTPELAGFQDEDIILLKPFVKALQRKGFECYADPENYALIVTCEI
ncbi:MAG: hypothetical protein IJW20_06180 [Clostridia bacterium]|nr:hypothetical protein [Clostridia bacterium]